MQAQTVARRFEDASLIWSELDDLAERLALPNRVTNLLYYVARPELRAIREHRRRQRHALHDPYPAMSAQLASAPG